MGMFLLLSKSGASTGLDWSEIFLLIFGLMVAIGVLGESTKSEKWKKWHRTFELLVIIGVAGELFADGTIFVFSKHLQTISDTELAVALAKAGDAKTSADNAAGAAGRANDSSRKANQQAHEAQVSAEKANNLAMAARERLIALTPRNLNINQQRELLDLTERLNGLPATLNWPQHDPEVGHIAGQIMEVLTPWKMQWVNFVWASYTMPGIQIRSFSSASAEQRQAARELAQQLSKYLRNVSLSIDEHVTPPGNTEKDAQGAFTITVGPLLWGSP